MCKLEKEQNAVVVIFMSGPFPQVSHAAVMNMCRAHKHVSELYPSREVTLCLDPYSGLGLLLWLLTG